jgi:DNA-directed RNA polymerase specialized sigma24 family protein
VDNVSVTSPDASDRDDSDHELNRLRSQAQAGRISVDDFMAACWAYARSHARWRIRASADQDVAGYGETADDIAQEALYRAIRAYGELLDQKSDRGREPPRYVAGILRITVARLVRGDVARSQRRRTGSLEDDYRGEVRSLWEHGARDADPVASQALAFADRQLVEVARAQARSHLAAFREIPPGKKQCPFHRTSAAGCPHRAEVFELVERFIDGRFGFGFGFGLTEAYDTGGADDPVRMLGRELGLSDRDNTLGRNLRYCFEWWRYLAFAGTVIDQPRGGGDMMRRPLVKRLAAAKKEADWDSNACPLRGARQIVATAPGEFERLLNACGSDAYDYLERGPADGRSLAD